MTQHHREYMLTSLTQALSLRLTKLELAHLPQALEKETGRGRLLLIFFPQLTESIPLEKETIMTFIMGEYISQSLSRTLTISGLGRLVHRP